MISGQAAGAQRFGKAKSAIELHRAGLGRICLGMGRGRGPIAEQQGRDAAMAQLVRQHQPCRPAANDDYRRIKRHRSSSPRPCPWSRLPLALAQLQEAPMLYLYQGSTSVCSVKVRLALAEKGLAYGGEVLDLQRGDQHRPDYAKLNPNEVVPTLVHDGKIIIESTLIIEYLDEAFPTPALMPGDPYARAIARLFMKKIDDYLHAACSTITFATANRRVLIKKTSDELAA